MARSFVVEFDCDEDGAEADLDAMSDEQRKEAIGLLTRLRDRDIFRFKQLAWRRGPLGPWVLVCLDRWRYLCQWEEGMPNLWRLGMGHGTLTVARVVPAEYAQVMLEQAEKEIDDT